MCVGCMSSAEFVVASGAVTLGGIRLGLRALLPETPSFLRKVSDEEAAAFLASYARPAGAETSASASV